MAVFKNISENELVPMGFVDATKILQYVTQEQVYELALGYQPKEYDYIKAPYRVDEEAGCWFEFDDGGKLMFKDFAYGKRPLDCFDLVQIMFNLPNFYQTLLFVKKALIDGKDITAQIKHVEASSSRRKVKGVNIFMQTRDFSSRDKVFWQKYQISKAHLIEDRVFAVSRAKLVYKDKKKEPVAFNIQDICYAYTDFDTGHKKLYRPTQEGKLKFLTNCTQDDIGGYNSLIPCGRQLIITKSYKDYRVLKNQKLNVIWFQNEGMYPNLGTLKELCSRFESILVFYDNDAPGIRASQDLVDVLSQFSKNVWQRHIPLPLLKEGITDPSDFIHRKGRENLVAFLRQNKIITYE
jgi:hypothetical protein